MNNPFEVSKMHLEHHGPETDQHESPVALLQWLKENVKSSAKLKGRVRTAEEVLDDLEGSDWEVSDLVFQELTRMGYQCRIIFLSSQGDHFTHSCVAFQRENGPWKWFDWRSPEDCGIYGPMLRLRDLVAMMKEHFSKNYKKVTFAGMGTDRIERGFSISDYLTMVKGWERPPRRLNA